MDAPAKFVIDSQVDYQFFIWELLEFQMRKWEQFCQKGTNICVSTSLCPYLTLSIFAPKLRQLVLISFWRLSDLQNTACIVASGLPFL